MQPTASAAKIRPLHPGDAAAFSRIVSHADIARELDRLPILVKDETDGWIQQAHTGWHRLVAEVAGQVVGFTFLQHFQGPRLRHFGRVWVAVEPAYREQGIGSALLAGAIELADNWFNLLRLEVTLLAENRAAARLLEMFGFAPEGVKHRSVLVDEKWRDEVVLARLRNTEHLVASEALPVAHLTEGARAIDDLAVRPTREADATDLHEVFRHPLVGQGTLQIPSIELPEIEERIGRRIPGRHSLVAVADGKVIGNIALFEEQHPHRPRTGHFGMMVHPRYWGQGVGTTLMQEMVRIADQELQLRRVDMEVYTDNSSAIRLYQRFGFHVEGTLRFFAYGAGRWADAHFMARLRHS